MTLLAEGCGRLSRGKSKEGGNLPSSISNEGTCRKTGNALIKGRGRFGIRSIGGIRLLPG